MKMKTIKKYLINRNYVLAVTLTLLLTSACTDLLDEPLENQDIAENIDYSQSENMILMLYGAYADFNALQWETFPIISVRGDDVNAAVETSFLCKKLMNSGTTEISGCTIRTGLTFTRMCCTGTERWKRSTNTRKQVPMPQPLSSTKRRLKCCACI
jgi:hypothetical protein